MRKTNLFIVGSPKCGSTLLASELSKNKGFFLPSTKELNYFSFDYLKMFNSYYRSYMVKTLKDYERLYKGGINEKYRIDASISYFTFEGLPERIRRYNHASKIIICYRFPFERAISHYFMDKRMGYTEEAFESLISNESSFFYHQYVENSLFFKHSKRFVDTFGEANVFFYDVKKNNDSDLSMFLGTNISINTNVKVNAAKRSKNSLGAFVLKNRHIAEVIKKRIPSFARIIVKSLIYSNSEIKAEPPVVWDERIYDAILDDWNMFIRTYIEKKI